MVRLPSVIVDPSSLIFVVIVAIWAAYLLGRRDQVATARSVDRFSEAMRVLERRPAVRSVPLSRPNPRSYVVAPAQRPAATLTVKRAEAVARPEPSMSAHAATPSQQPLARQPGRRARQLRGLVLLGLLVATPASWLLAATTVAVTWWVAALVTLALLGLVAGLRRSALRARASARRRETRERRSATAARRETRRHVVGQLAATRRDAPPAEPATVEQEVADGEAVSDVVPDGGWQPVPVPPPTYTLKPKAPSVRQHPVVPPVAQVDPPVEARREEPAPAPSSAPGFDLDEILERRIAAGG